MNTQPIITMMLAFSVLVLAACDSGETIVEVTRIVEVTVESVSVLPEPELSSIFERVQAQGRLLCGGRSDNLPGYNAVDQEGTDGGRTMNPSIADAKTPLAGDILIVDNTPA